MERMTIHRGLAELKLIDSKIEKQINCFEYCGLMQENKKVNNFYDKDVFDKEVSSKYQSVKDLFERKLKIKSEIVISNSTTLIEICNKKILVSDAINFKSIVLLKKQLITKMKNDLSKSKSLCNTENEKIEKVALENAKIMLGKESDSSVKPTDKDVEAIVDPFVKRNKLILVDPLSIEKEIEKLENEIIDFESNIDSALSESNATTFIEI